MPATLITSPLISPLAELARKTTAGATAASPTGAPTGASAGTIETIEAADKELKAGDVIATLVGAKALSTELDNLKKDLDTAAPAIAAAEKALSDAQQVANNAAGVTAAQGKLDKLKKPVEDKKATIAKKQAELDKLTIKAGTDGKLVPTAKVGQKLAAEETIATIVRPTVAVATFKVPPGTKIAADGNLSIISAEKTIVCTVTDAQAETVKVTCPSDAGLANGAPVKFTLPH